ncbi:hypothetical protein [Streptomyces phaeochromogenes]|uniref:Nickel/cobalt efflux system n=1 Tax=Streptomyces phaeochromogenes TaxID=1923 RepID=A0ABZ1HR03_STRPH|nr:hypothetical protein [Streptomyces phaeochromogenes]WSD21015.1 hypothetical protein OHB35_51555 [Streptomyces phaeochromogenes]
MLTVRPILPKIEGGLVQGLLQLIEDGIHLVVAALLVLLAGLLTVGVVHDVIRSIQGPYREETVVLSALDNGLVLFIVAAVYVWWRSTRPGDYFPLQEARRSPSPEPSPTPVRGS